MDLNGKTALVTGASRGIGEASAIALDRAGARVLVSGRTVSDLERVQLFFTEHLTPEVIQFPAFLSHDNDAKKLYSVTIAADEPEALRHLFESCIGVAPSRDADGALRFQAGFATVAIIPVHSMATRFPGCDVEQNLPYLIGLCLAVGDISLTVSCLTRGKIPFTTDNDGVLTVAPKDACGVLLQFREMQS